ncbi:MAG: hypothetical protein ACREPW_04380 [Candidatus Binataceae bacterium]
MNPGVTKTKCAIRIAMRRRAIVLAAILAPLILAACAATKKPPPVVPDIPLSSYTAFELPPVANQSGQPAGVAAAQIISEGIAAELKNRGYNIVANAPSESEPLLIKCELTAYQPNTSTGNRGTTGITLKVTFMDMKNGHLRGEFDDAQNVQGGGLESDREILLGFAKGAGIQIDSRIKG